MKINKEISKQFAAFLTSNQRRMWLQTSSGSIKVYVRKSMRFDTGTKSLSENLDIASIEVKTPGKKIGTSILNYLHENNPFEVTFIENVLNDKFKAWLIRDGWQKHHYIHCFFKFAVK